MKPEDVLHNWDVANITSSEIKKASSGLLNKTFLIRAGESNTELFVLQCVHPAVSMDGAMNNYFHVTQFLKEQGTPTQTVLRTKEDSLWVEDNEETDAAGKVWRWRLLTGVEGDVYDKELNPELVDVALANAAGSMLAKFHTTLSQYPKQLEQGRLSFRYDQEIKKLNQFQEQLMADADESIRDAAQLLISEMPKLALPSDLPQTIIHADPKVSNFVFDETKAGICMIDLDTLQVLSPLYDLGDAVRSWCGQKEDNPNNPFNLEIYNAFLEGYLANSKGLLSEREQSLIPQAAKLIMLGLATRFLNDYIEDSYFGWDETKYESRKAHNRARALGQISLYQNTLKSLSN
jgi:Ser/Thr protein kinase RdoA (MazF antagonist)